MSRETVLEALRRSGGAVLSGEELSRQLGLSRTEELLGLLGNPQKELKFVHVAGTNGKRIVYLNGYGELRRFLVEVLKWTDDDNHTLPQMKPFRNFVLMTEPEKGILLAKDVCECIADPDNPMYAPDAAAKNAFRLLTEETLCPPDLLLHCLEHHLLPDAVFPDGESRTTVQENADFIARHALLYYYRGD